jgi:8-oxo-dGTP diphosphatase
VEQKIIATVDVVLLTIIEDRLEVLLVKRAAEPFAGRWALPGGYVHVEEDGDALATARRVLEQKAGIVSPYLEQLCTFSGHSRDPRGWSVSIAYFALVPRGALAPQKSSVCLQAVDGLAQLPFDHNRIVDAAVARVRSKAGYSSLPAFLLPETFTLTELQQAYEQVIGTTLDKSAFRRKLGLLDFLEPVKNRSRTGKHRPAQLFRIRKDRRLALFGRTLAS